LDALAERPLELVAVDEVFFLKLVFFAWNDLSDAFLLGASVESAARDFAIVVLVFLIVASSLSVCFLAPGPGLLFGFCDFVFLLVGLAFFIYMLMSEYLYAKLRISRVALGI
jgi:hypothetical protein